MEHLLRVFNKANVEDRKIAEDAWFKMRRLTAQIASKHGFSHRIGAAVFAALSPNSSYHGNLRDTDRVLAAAAAGLGLDDFKVSTYGNNKRKAWRIAKGEEPLDLIVFDKTRNFFLNVDNPVDPFPVTIDGHMFNAWFGKRTPLKGVAMKGNGKLYNQVASDVREIGQRHGLLPNVVQGTIWFTWRRTHNILTPKQKELWDAESLAANCGWVPALT